jgi:DNA-binding beta-propeller fold protein YncE
MYTINPTTGVLASIGPPVPTNDEFTDSVTVDPSGKFAYVASSGDVWDIDFGTVVTYAINPTTGILKPTGPIATELSPTSIAIHPSGKFAYVTNSASNDVSMYSIGTTGTLTLIATIGT